MNWKIHLYRAILWLITLSLLLVMFGFSAQEGTQSGSISDKIARPITDSLAQRQGLTGQAYWKLYAQVDFAVRKTAHFLEYMLLGLLLTLLLDSLTVIASFFFFNAGIVYLPQEVDSAMIPLLAIFLVVIALSILLQQKTVDLTKEINPEKRGSVYDMKFQERWWESCDEAERRQIGQASYKAYTTLNKFCPYCWGVLFLGNMIFHYGILPSTVVLLVWAVLTVSYTREAIRLSRGSR